jgi:hypothetical protein
MTANTSKTESYQEARAKDIESDEDHDLQGGVNKD